MTDRYPAGADAFARKEWAEAYRLLSASSIEELTAADLTRLAVSAYLIGEDDEAFAAWERAHRRHLDAGDSAEERLRRWVQHPEPIASGSLERNQLPRRWAGPLRPPVQGESTMEALTMACALARRIMGPHGVSTPSRFHGTRFV